MILGDNPMRRVFVVLTAVMLVSLPVLAGAASEYNSKETNKEGSENASNLRPIPAEEWIFGAPVWRPAEAGVLYDNGPVANSFGTGANGEDESVLQTTSLQMNTLGAGHQVLNNNRVADDFVVPTGETWEVNTATFFAYQTGSSNVSTITAVNVQIWDGVPGEAGSNVIFGDGVTNRMTDTEFSNILRVTEETTGISTDRPIMAQTATIGIPLTEGTYWIDWQTDGTLGSGPWAPPITITGQNTTGNALQSIDGAPYLELLDSGTGTAQGLPFILSTGDDVGLELTLSGSCPGSQTVEITGLTPNGTVVVAIGTGTDGTILPSGPCAGDRIELSGIRTRKEFTADTEGRVLFVESPEAPACDDFVQAVDLESCEISQVAPVS